MSANFRKGKEPKFQQRWDFRRGDSDFDSSSFDSKSSLNGEPTHKKNKLALVPVDNDETSDTIRFQQKGYNDPGISGQTGHGKAEKGKRGGRKNTNFSDNKTESAARKEATRKRGKDRIDEHAALDDLKNYMNSLLEELKVTRKNLLSWMKEEMKKLVDEEKASESERKEVNFREEEDPLKYQNNKSTVKYQNNKSEVNQYQNLFGKNIQVQHQNNFEEYSQLQHQSKFPDNMQMQQAINLEGKVEGHPGKNCQEKVQVQRRHRSRTGTGTQTCNGRSKKSDDPNNCTAAEDNKSDHSQTIVLLTPSEENGKEKLALSDNSNSKPGPSDPNVQVKSIVLGIRAQNCSNGSPLKSAKGKRAAGSNSHRQVPNYQVDYSQDIVSIPATEKDKGERSGLFMEPSFSTDSFNQMASSMYLTLPTALPSPHIPTHKHDTSPFSYMQPTFAQNQAGTNAERSNSLPGSSSHLGYYQGLLQAEEKGRNLAEMSSRDASFLYQNSTTTTTSLIGSGFTVPLQAVHSGFNIPDQFHFESLRPREYNNTLGLSMNGGAIRFSGGGYSLPEPYLANNSFHSHSNFRADGRLMTYQDSYQFPK